MYLWRCNCGRQVMAVPFLFSPFGCIYAYYPLVSFGCSPLFQYCQHLRVQEVRHISFFHYCRKRTRDSCKSVQTVEKLDSPRTDFAVAFRDLEISELAILITGEFSLEWRAPAISPIRSYCALSMVAGGWVVTNAFTRMLVDLLLDVGSLDVEFLDAFYFRKAVSHVTFCSWRTRINRKSRGVVGCGDELTVHAYFLLVSVLVSFLFGATTFWAMQCLLFSMKYCSFLESSRVQAL